MKVLVTGSKGFIGKNLSFWLSRLGYEILPLDKDNFSELPFLVTQADFIIHLAGVNRPLTKAEFYGGNYDLTKQLVDLIKQNKKAIPIILSSSIQADLDTDYGKSKKMAEDYLLSSGLPVYIYRLANVFGKWCRPNYNSVVATFCYNIAHNLPIEIRDPNYVIHFNYVDDVCKEFIRVLSEHIPSSSELFFVQPTYDCSLGHLADLLYYFKKSIESPYHLPDIHNEFELKLFETFCDYFSEEGHSFNFVEDSRGSFKEIFKSSKYGQISINESFPGVIKGDHYHTYKQEVFMTVLGKCKTRIRKIDSNQIAEYVSTDQESRRINIMPGYTHDITNIGDSNSKVAIWISEIFSEKTSDTYREDVELK